VKSRTLGPTGYTVSEIGFGGWGLGADMWRGVDDAMAREALHAAVDQGVTFFDTALAYGTGHSERLIGEVLRDEIRAGRVRVATKVPPLNNEWPGRANRPLAAVFPARHVAASTETSLKNLGVEALSLQQLHVWHDAWLDDPEWTACYEQMVRLKREGKVLHWGISINDHAPETALRVLQNPLFETAQVIYNIYDRSPETALFPSGDWREEYFSGDRRAEAERRSMALAQLLGEEVETLPELALRFCVSSPAVSTVIPGMRRPAHVRQNAAASAKGPLSAGLLSKLEAHAWDKNWYPD